MAPAIRIVATSDKDRLALKKALGVKSCLYLDNKNRSYTWKNYNNTIQTINYWSYGSTPVLAPIEIMLINHHKNGYNFIQEEFDLFINNVTYMSSKSYLLDKNCYLLNNVINTLFKKFTPNKKQFKQLITCYPKYSSIYKSKSKSKTESELYWEWVNILLNRDHEFTIPQIKLLLEKGFPFIEIIPNNIDYSDFIDLAYGLPDETFTITLEMVTKIKNHKQKNRDLLIFIAQYSQGCTEELFNYIVADTTFKIDTNFFKCFTKKVLQCNPFYELLLKHTDINNLDDDTFDQLIQCKKLTLEFAVLLCEVGLKATTDVLHYVLNLMKDKEFYAPMHRIFKNKFLIHAYSNDKKDGVYGSIDGCNINILKYLVDKGATPNTETLRIVVAGDLHDLRIKELLIDYKITPTKEILDTIVSINNKFYVPIIETILNYKILPDKKTYLSNNNAGINELLITHGMQVDLDMVDKSLKDKDPIFDLHRFNIPYDGKLYYCCHKHNNFPEQYMKLFTIDKKVIALRGLFKREILWHKIKKYLKQHNLKVDRYCFENAKTNIKDILTKLGAEPTTRSIYNLLPEKGNGRMYMDQLFSDKFETAEQMEQTYDIQI